MLGQKLRDGLRVYADMSEDRRSNDGYCGAFADARLVELGYPEKVADSIIERLARKGYTECGVSERSGWLTPSGIEALRTS